MRNDKDDDGLASPGPARGWRHFHRGDDKWTYTDAPEEAALRAGAPIELHVIEREPPDYPDKWVVRRWRIGDNERWIDQTPVAVADTLEQARQMLQPRPKQNLGRYTDPDLPWVYEAWM